MKYPVIYLMIPALLILLSPEIKSQVRVDVKGKVNSEADNRANRATDRAIDAGFDKLEEGIKGVFKKKDKSATGKKTDAKKTDAVDSDAEDTDEGISASEKKAGENKAGRSADPVLSWSKYDFVPGDKVIFEDNLTGERNGEFPSRWDLEEGTVECASLDGENVIMFRRYGSAIIPYMKNPESDYLPDIFTIEFDAFIPHDHIEVFFYDTRNQSSPHNSNEKLYVMGDGMELGSAASNLPGNANLEKSWMHVSIAYTSGKMKAYINETRLINIPNLGFNPTGITIRALHSGDESHYYIKNIRIAEGGVSYYDRYLQDGKIIANGIRFDVNKATLKPESMGIINEIAALMKQHPEIKFSIEGHTDSDGDDAFNQTLSEQRAATVKAALTKMGIASERLSSKGWGESKPVDSNGTPEGKANNRRVEFVKI
ncbi:MAG TPA: OmpA family protein [Bacteroidales bacterium]|jgi:outer membrane protein OmpA-like peptidoglycan-associated protein|nr:OmpA family protein [Bacteroidales bacterium]